MGVLCGAVYCALNTACVCSIWSSARFGHRNEIHFRILQRRHSWRYNMAFIQLNFGNAATGHAMRLRERKKTEGFVNLLDSGQSEGETYNGNGNYEIAKACALNPEGFQNLPGFWIECREKCQRLKFSEIPGRFSKPAGCEVTTIKLLNQAHYKYV